MWIYINKITRSYFYHGNPYDGKMASFLYNNWDHMGASTWYLVVIVKSQHFLKAHEP